MNMCLYEPMNGSYPQCDGKCKWKDGKCPYYFVDVIYAVMNAWKSEAETDTPILWKYERKRNKVCLYTTKPGRMIGGSGKLYNKYLKKLQELSPEYFKNGIDIIECEDGI